MTRAPRPNFFHHLHPPTIPARQSRLRYTLGAGGISIFLVLILIVTGILEMFYYVPTPEGAALSIQTITYHVPLGALVRNLHFWSAQVLMIVMGLHLVRVVFTGAYGAPRRFNFVLGVLLMGVVILLNFTGYVLRWDEGIQWALVVGTNLLKTVPVAGDALYGIVAGGSEPGASTLTRFYAWHLFGLAVPAIFFIGWHIFRVRRDGGIAVPPPAARTESQRISRFQLVEREVVAMLIVGGGLLVFSALVPAPIAPPITDISASASHTDAPWFLLWIQRLLAWGDPFLLGVLVPFAVLTLLAVFPYILPKPDESELGRWFPRSNRSARLILALLVVAIALLTLVPQ